MQVVSPRAMVLHRCVVSWQDATRAWNRRKLLEPIKKLGRDILALRGEWQCMRGEVASALCDEMEALQQCSLRLMRERAQRRGASGGVSGHPVEGSESCKGCTVQ